MGIKFNPLLFSGLDLTGDAGSVNIGDPIGGADPKSVLTIDESGNLTDVPLSDGQLVIGSSTSKPAAGSLTGTANQVIVTPGTHSITLSLPQSIATTSSPQFANVVLAPSGSLDITNAGGTLALGTTNADIINIGNSGATVNVQGSTFYQNVTDLQVADKNISLNVGGSAGSASSSGIQIEENALITGYVTTSADRNSWEAKAPGQNGIVTISPGASGFTISQGSHSPVTLTAVGSSPNANAASLATQALTLQPADATNPGVLTAGAQSIGGNKTFTGSIGASNLSGTNTGDQTITLTGDVTGSGTGSFATTIANNAVTNAKIANSTIDLTTKVTGALPIANGGTNSASALSNSKVMVSTGGAIVESATTTTQLGYLDATSSIQTQLNSKVNTVSGDIVPTSWAGLANNIADQVITGLAFAVTVSSFEVLMNVFIHATSDTYTTVKLIGTRQASSDWSTYDLSSSFMGASVTGLAFNMTSAGQVRITIGSISGFSSGLVKFRATSIS